MNAKWIIAVTLVAVHQLPALAAERCVTYEIECGQEVGGNGPIGHRQVFRGPSSSCPVGYGRNANHASPKCLQTEAIGATVDEIKQSVSMGIEEGVNTTFAKMMEAQDARWAALVTQLTEQQTALIQEIRALRAAVEAKSHPMPPSSPKPSSRPKK